MGRVNITLRSWTSLAVTAIAALALTLVLGWRLDLSIHAEANADLAAARAETAARLSIESLSALRERNAVDLDEAKRNLTQLGVDDPALASPALALSAALGARGRDGLVGADQAALDLVRAANAQARSFEAGGDDVDSQGDMIVWLIAPILAVSTLLSIWLLISDWRRVTHGAEIAKAQRDMAVETAAAKSLMLAAASHDVRQPLHALSLFVAALKRRVDTDEAKDILGKIEQASGSLRRLFSSLLDVARLEAGVVRAEMHPFALQPLLTQLVDEAHEIARAQGGHVALDETPLWINSDPQLFEAIVRNLLSNAVKASGAGEVRVRVRDGIGAATIEVSDSGADPQVDVLRAILAGRAPEGARVGLGLFIVREMAAILNLTVTADEAPSGGALVTVVAPIAAPQPRRADTGALST